MLLMVMNEKNTRKTKQGKVTQYKTKYNLLKFLSLNGGNIMDKSIDDRNTIGQAGIIKAGTLISIVSPQASFVFPELMTYPPAVQWLQEAHRFWCSHRSWYIT